MFKCARCYKSLSRGQEWTYPNLFYHRKSDAANWSPFVARIHSHNFLKPALAVQVKSFELHGSCLRPPQSIRIWAFNQYMAGTDLITDAGQERKKIIEIGVVLLQVMKSEIAIIVTPGNSAKLKQHRECN